MATAHDMYDVVVVGAGFSGVYLLQRLKALGLSVCCLEAGDDVGGTWYWNRYPGCRCDVESWEYAYSHDRELTKEWDWTERYAGQAEIQAYIAHASERFGVRDAIDFQTRLEAADWLEAEQCWRVSSSKGQLLARFLVMATGCLSETHTPKFQGLEGFTGSVYHTGRWPKEAVDFRGKRVAVIGTGSTAVQIIPCLAEEAAHVAVLQRTPGYVFPARNGAFDPDLKAYVKEHHAEIQKVNKYLPFGAYALQVPPSLTSAASWVGKEVREKVFDYFWQKGGLAFNISFCDLLLSRSANKAAREFVAGKIRETVKDPAIAEALTPNYPFGCKRPCLGTNYYESFNRSNVELVSCQGIELELTASAVKVGEREIQADIVVMATGYDAMTGALLRPDIRGRGGVLLRDKWKNGDYRSYLGLQTSGFPNLFTVTGPGSPSVLSNMVTSIEQHVDWISRTIDYMRGRGATVMEATVAAEESWTQHVQWVFNLTALGWTKRSWYTGANIKGKAQLVYPYLGCGQYRLFCDQAAANGYRGFRLYDGRGALVAPSWYEYLFGAWADLVLKFLAALKIGDTRSVLRHVGYDVADAFSPPALLTRSRLFLALVVVLAVRRLRSRGVH